LSEPSHALTVEQLFVRDRIARAMAVTEPDELRAMLAHLDRARPAIRERRRELTRYLNDEEED
jgi:hypothetical protein